MRTLILKLIEQLVRLLYVEKITLLFFYAHKRNLKERLENRLFSIYLGREKGELKVMSGPFKSLVYANKSSYGSVFFPKILGTYETELQSIIDIIIKSKFDIIIDVGCAEGYYSAGLALTKPDSFVYAIDIDERARELCRLNVEANKLSNVSIINHLCIKELIDWIDQNLSVFIISDCEGYELEFFSQIPEKYLSRIVCLIETHDSPEVHISTALLDFFKNTHNYERIKSICDIQKVHTYSIPGIDFIDNIDKYMMLKECRTAHQEWLYFSPK